MRGPVTACHQGRDGETYSRFIRRLQVYDPLENTKPIATEAWANFPLVLLWPAPGRTLALPAVHKRGEKWAMTVARGEKQ